MTMKDLSDFSIKKVHRFIDDENTNRLTWYLEKFLLPSFVKKNKAEIEGYANELITSESYPLKKNMLKKLEEWNT